MPTYTDLQGRVAIITGASRGIGRAIALRLAKEGVAVVIAAKTAEPDPRLPGTIYTVAEEVAALGGRALPLQVDVRDENALQRMVDATLETFGRIDILVNNAGALWWYPVLETPPKRFDLVMQVNLRASFRRLPTRAAHDDSAAVGAYHHHVAPDRPRRVAGQGRLHDFQVRDDDAGVGAGGGGARA
jgi:NAD(P)-dependent dehydrogenase (short-subunit alcohol dehydrogenase family)